MADCMDNRASWHHVGEFRHEPFWHNGCQGRVNHNLRDMRENQDLQTSCIRCGSILLGPAIAPVLEIVGLVVQTLSWKEPLRPCRCHPTPEQPFPKRLGFAILN